MTSRLIAVWLATLVSLAGCSASAVKTQYYTLHPQSDAVALSEAEKIVGGLGIGPVNLPESIQQTAIVSYGQQNRVLVASGHLWSGDLKRSLSRVLAADIGQMLNKTDVWAYPWDMQPRPRHRIPPACRGRGHCARGLDRRRWRRAQPQGRAHRARGVSVGHSGADPADD